MCEISEKLPDYQGVSASADTWIELAPTIVQSGQNVCRASPCFSFPCPVFHARTQITAHAHTHVRCSHQSGYIDIQCDGDSARYGRQRVIVVVCVYARAPAREGCRCRVSCRVRSCAQIKPGREGSDARGYPHSPPTTVSPCKGESRMCSRRLGRAPVATTTTLCGTEGTRLSGST